MLLPGTEYWVPQPRELLRNNVKYPARFGRVLILLSFFLCLSGSKNCISDLQLPCTEPLFASRLGRRRPGCGFTTAKIRVSGEGGWSELPGNLCSELLWTILDASCGLPYSQTNTAIEDAKLSAQLLTFMHTCHKRVYLKDQQGAVNSLKYRYSCLAVMQLYPGV